MMSSFGLKVECLSFFPQSLVWHLGTESRHNKNFDTRDRCQYSLRKLSPPPPPPICIQMPLLLPYFYNFSSYPSSEVRAFLEKKFIFLKSSLKGLLTLLISFSFEKLEFSTIFTHFGDQACNRIMATNNRTMGV